MLNQYEHANKLRQSCRNMKVCRDAAKALKKRLAALDDLERESDPARSASNLSSPVSNLQGKNDAVSGG